MQVLDWFLTILHLFIVGFNLFAWIPKRTRRAHLWFAGLTLGSWIGLAPWFGLGYCPVTDWQWEVKRKLGETNLPGSFVKYYADKISGQSISAEIVDGWTLGLFAAAILLSVLFNLRDYQMRKYTSKVSTTASQ